MKSIIGDDVGAVVEASFRNTAIGILAAPIIWAFVVILSGPWEPSQMQVMGMWIVGIGAMLFIDPPAKAVVRC
jgi:hypothetical protein